MTDLYWLRPEWKQATCQRCGVNIWDAGGDPDHGLCPNCFNQQWAEQHPPEPPEPILPEPDYEAIHLCSLLTRCADALEELADKYNDATKDTLIAEVREAADG